MRSVLRAFVVALLAGIAVPGAAPIARAEEPGALPDAPMPQSEQLAGNSQSTVPAGQPGTGVPKGVQGVINASGIAIAPKLSPGQKIEYAFRTAANPGRVAIAAIVAGIHEGLDEDEDIGWGAEGYGKRVGVAYLDSFSGTILGNGVMPIVFHQDPRYFRMGQGGIKRRLLYSVSRSFVTRHDGQGRWEPNYSKISGNMIAGALSNLYYPEWDSGWKETVADGLTVTATGSIGNVFREFWPDISRKFLHKKAANPK